MTATLISKTDVPSQDPNRAGKMDAFITYSIDPLHRYTIKVPAEGLTADKVDALIRQDWQQQKLLFNRQIKL